MNKTSAEEWLTKSWHHFSSGRVLYNANHYTDTIGIDLHYSVEIMLKSILAYENKKIPKTHDLIEVSKLIKDYLNFDNDEIDMLIIISEYHIMESYPAFNRLLPTIDEIKEVINFAQVLFKRVCKILDIDMQEVMR